MKKIFKKQYFKTVYFAFSNRFDPNYKYSPIRRNECEDIGDPILKSWWNGFSRKCMDYENAEIIRHIMYYTKNRLKNPVKNKKRIRKK